MILTAVLIIIVALFGFVVLFGAPYVPSKRREVADVFENLYRVTKKDTLVDIGSGDGVVLREAAKHGAKAVGYEINPLLVLVSRFLSRKDERVEIRLANLFTSTFPDDTTLVYMFSESRDIKRMFAKIEKEAARLGRPLTVISYGFQYKQRKVTRQSGAHFMYVVNPKNA